MCVLKNAVRQSRKENVCGKKNTLMTPFAVLLHVCDWVLVLSAWTPHGPALPPPLKTTVFGTAFTILFRYKRHASFKSRVKGTIPFKEQRGHCCLEWKRLGSINVKRKFFALYHEHHHTFSMGPIHTNVRKHSYAFARLNPWCSLDEPTICSRNSTSELFVFLPESRRKAATSLTSIFLFGPVYFLALFNPTSQRKRRWRWPGIVHTHGLMYSFIRLLGLLVPH